MKDLFVVAHPDDGEVMLGNAIAASAEPLVVVGTDGTASIIDIIGRGFCPSWTQAARVTGWTSTFGCAAASASILGA
jgi:hypothetical protein